MRKFLVPAFLLVAFTCQPALAQKAPEPEPPKILVEKYQKALADMQNWAKNLTNDKFYEDRFNFKAKDTEKPKKFSEFSEYDRRMFQMLNTQNFNNYLGRLENAWQDELKAAKGKTPDSKGDPKAIAGADDIAVHVKELIKVRQTAVASWEAQANKMFKDFPKEFKDERERTLYLKNIQTLKESLEGR